MAAQKQDDQHERTFSSYVRIQVVVLKTYLGRWTIGRSGERGSGISVLPAQYDDDDDFQKLVRSMSLKVLSIPSHYFFQCFWQHLNSTLEKYVFWGSPQINPFFGIFIRMKVLLSQAKCHWSEQVTVGWGNVRWIHWLG